METWIRSLERKEKDAAEWKTLETYQKLERLRGLLVAIENKQETLGENIDTDKKKFGSSEDSALLSRHDDRLDELDSKIEPVERQLGKLVIMIDQVSVRLEKMEVKK